MKSIAEKITPILQEIENALWEYEANNGPKPNFPPEALKSAVKIFTVVLFDKIFELQEKENMSIKEKAEMSIKFGEEIKRIVKIYADIDTKNFY